jgi:hypothetical protein
MNVRVPIGGTSRSWLSGRIRRPVWVLTWVAVGVLGCFLIAVASGLISDKVQDLSGSAVTEPQGPPWGAPSSYVGQYHLRAVLPVVAPTPGHGGGTTTRGIPQFRISSGDLTVFLRVVKHGLPLAPSGILALRGPTGSELVYLTDLTSSHGILAATVNGGAYLGPVVGSFAGFRSHGAIVGLLGLAGSKPVEIRLNRYSRSAPSP